MSFVEELHAKFSHLKDVAEGDLHALVLKLEAVFNRVHQAQVADGLKQAVSSDIHTALDHVAVVAENVSAKAAEVDKAVVAVTQVAKNAAGK